jgi:NTP pyrophosphatase (non-canonical NTP hydrolase)
VSEISFDEYQEATSKTAIYRGVGTGNFDAVNYCLVGMAGEIGEIMNKWGKIIRDQGGIPTDEQRKDLAKEAGDVLWFSARALDELGTPFGDVAESNLAKLKSRQERGVLSGSGDNR